MQISANHEKTTTQIMNKILLTTYSSKMQEVVIRRTILRTAVLARPAQPRATWINTPGNPGTFSLSRTHPRSGGSRGWVALNAILF